MVFMSKRSDSLLYFAAGVVATLVVNKLVDKRKSRSDDRDSGRLLLVQNNDDICQAEFHRQNK